jgi:Trypsin-like serine proteases, typically periplasmic, contain C-terminal PDZ domain
MDEMGNNLESELSNVEESVVANAENMAQLKESIYEQVQPEEAPTVFPEVNTANYIYDENKYYNGAIAREAKPKRGIGKKVISLVLSGILFGGVAGGTFQAVDYVSNRNKDKVAEENSIDAETLISTNRGQAKVEAINTSSGSIQGSVSAVAKNSMPSIVSITKTTVGEMYHLFGREMQVPGGEHSGSGIIVGENDTELLIVTNNHVVENSEELTVVFIDDSVVTAQVKGTDPENDLAVIAIKLEDMKIWRLKH